MTRIVPLDRYNWELVLNIQLSPEQEQFLPSVLYSLAQARFEQLHPFGILSDEEMVGLLMYGQFGGICWINRIMIDKDHQRKGIGSAAVEALLRDLRFSRKCGEVRTSFAKNNYPAEQFFHQLGFQNLPDGPSDETVAVYNP